jgi:hypothetical protein
MPRGRRVVLDLNGVDSRRNRDRRPRGDRRQQVPESAVVGRHSAGQARLCRSDRQRAPARPPLQAPAERGRSSLAAGRAERPFPVRRYWSQLKMQRWYERLGIQVNHPPRRRVPERYERPSIWRHHVAPPRLRVPVYVGAFGLAVGVLTLAGLSFSRALSTRHSRRPRRPVHPRYLVATQSAAVGGPCLNALLKGRGRLHLTHATSGFVVELGRWPASWSVCDQNAEQSSPSCYRNALMASDLLSRRGNPSRSGAPPRRSARPRRRRARADPSSDRAPAAAVRDLLAKLRDHEVPVFV